MEKKLSKKAIISIICVAVALIAITVTTIILLSSRGKKVSDIIVKDSNMPRTTYVQGQELELNGGVLTVISKKGNETEIPLTDSEVSVSGYDKNVLGKQTLTVTYQEMTTTFEVSVIARMVADGYKTEYFKGEEFDKTKGKLKITKDDGKTTTVSFDSEFVTITFNNTVAGDVPVTAVYDDKQGTRYETAFTVKCYEMGDITFVKPSKTVYQSHETELAVKGGFFNVKAVGSDYSIPVPLTINMTSGFNPSAATAANRKTPLSQTITCTYGGKSFEFNISIIYSSVSVVLDAAKALANVTVTDRNFTLNDELSAIAVDAATEYFKLTNDKKQLISEEDALKVMRPAAFCVTKAFAATAEKYNKIFVIDAATGNISISAQTYNDLNSALTDFNKKDDPFNVLADVLNDMKKDFADVLLFTENDDKGEPVDYTMENYIKAPGEDQRTFYKNLFQYMLSVSDKLSAVPADWSLDSTSDKYLGKYAKNITDTFDFITRSVYFGPNFNGPYNSISSWRGNDDFFEIIYNYYMKVADEDTKKDFLGKLITNQGIKCPLPGELQDWYTYLNRGYEQIVNYMVVTKNGETTYYSLYDTTLFMYYYNKTIELSKSIIDGEDQLLKDIYNLINGDIMIYNNIQTPYIYVYDSESKRAYPLHLHGYIYMTMFAPDSERFANLRASYMELANLYFEGKLNITDHKAKFEKMFSDLAALTPTEVYAFISSVNFLYSSSENYVLDYSERIYSYFTLFVSSYEKKYIENTEVLPIRQLLKAMELCAQIGARATVEDFRAAMDDLEAMMTGTALSQADKDAFMAIFGDCYNKYLGISNTLSGPQNFGEYEDEYNELMQTLKDFYTVYNVVFSENLTNEERQEAAKYYILLFSLCEKALSLRAELDNAPQEVINALYTVKYAINGTNEMTMENAYTFVSSFLYGQLMQQPLQMTETFFISFFTLYQGSSKVRTFMANLATPLMCYYNKQTVDMNAVVALMANFREFAASDSLLFAMFGNTLYYDMLLNVFSEENNEALNAFIKNLLQSELCYAEYIKDTTDANRIDFFVGEKGMGAAISAYNALGTEGQNNLNQALKDMYNHYKEIYDEIKSSDSSSDSDKT